MQRDVAICGTKLGGALQPLHTPPHDNNSMGTTGPDTLQHQQALAESMRQQQHARVPHKPTDACVYVQLLVQTAAELLLHIHTDLAAAGPLACAKTPCRHSHTQLRGVGTSGTRIKLKCS